MSEPPQLLLEAVYEQERTRPDAIYLTQPIGGGETRDYTWSEVMNRARRMAAYLRSLELPPGSNVGLISKNCAHFFMTDLAIWLAGHVTVALYPTLSPEMVSTILEHSECKLLFVGKLDGWDEVQQGIPEGLPLIALPLSPDTLQATSAAEGVKTWDEIIDGQQPIEDSPTPSAETPSIIAYTSGSTGQPKGVVHCFGSMSRPAHRLAEVLDFTPADRAFSYLPLAHLMERLLVECTSFYSGAHVYFAESLDTFVADLKRARPTLFVSVPRLWLKFQLGVHEKMPEKKLNRLLKIPILNRIVRKKVLDGLGLGSVRLAGSGSAPIPADLIAWYQRLGLTLLEGYGMSEDFGYSHLSTPERLRPGYVGIPYPDVETRISDDGEILVKSPGNMLGYFKEPEMTACCYTDDGFFRTGDRGEYSKDGLLKITGRVKELFKTSKGKYVAPAPIENLLNADGHVEMSCVSGLGRPQPYALVVLGEGFRGAIAAVDERAAVTAGLTELLARVNDQVEVYERLQFLAVIRDEWLIENGFLTPTMKIKRNVLEDRYAPLLDDWYASGQGIVWEA